MSSLRRRRVLAPALLVPLVLSAVLAVGSGPGPLAPRSAAAGPIVPLGYVAVTPCRVANTVPGAPLDASGAGATRTFQIAGNGPAIAAQGGTAGGCGVPVGAPQVEIAVTVIGPSAAGYLRAYAAGTVEPGSTFMNFADNVSMTNSAPLPLSAGGGLTLTTHQGAVDVVIEVLGYFDAAATLRFDPVAPCRVFNSTAGAPLASGEIRDLQVAGTGAVFATQGGKAGGCGVPDDAAAAELVLTAVGPDSNGYARLAPQNQGASGATVLNYVAGRSVANSSIVGLVAGAGVDVSLTNQGGPSDFVLDVVGYWRVGGSSTYVPFETPCRAVNTVAVDAPIPTGGTRAVQIAAVGPVLVQGQAKSSGGCGLWDGTTGVVGTVSAVDPSADGYLRLWPAGGAPPNATFMNFQSGESISATGSLSLGLVGTRDLLLRSFSGSTDVVVDLRGRYRVAPTVVDAVDEVAPGLAHTCVKVLSSLPRGNGAVCAGRNASGQLGDGTLVDKVTPVFVTQPASPTPIAVSAVASITSGFLHSCVRSNGGALQCWGGNLAGQVGSNSVSQSVTRALTVVSPGKVGVDRQVSAGGSTSCLVTDGASGQCWGDGTGGQLGNGGTASSSIPVAVQGLKAATASISAGLSHSCAVMLDSTVKCWGSNQFGQLGDGTNTPSSVPVAVTGLGKAVEVRAGAFHTCAILAGGGVRCWGKGLSGQLGNGVAANSSVPVDVTGITDATTLGAGGAYSCVTTAGGLVRCWGANGRGQLGDGTTTQRNSPVTASVVLASFTLPITGNTMVATGFDTTCAVAVSPKTRCWGNNTYGQVGDSSATDRLRPVLAFAP